MPRQLNLLAPTGPAARWSARLAGLAMIGLATLVGALATGLHTLGGQALAQATQLRQQAAPLLVLSQIDAASAPASASPELARLRLLDSGQSRIRAALAGGLAGARNGHADYFVALARQGSGQVWLTGFGVSEDGVALDLEGRMAEPGALADYLRRLNAEPRFKGRPFAQLSLNAMGPGSEGALPYTEFALRSQAVAAKAAP